MSIDNPTSRWHGRYQTMVNRWFIFVVAVMSLAFSAMQVGLANTAVGIFIFVLFSLAAAAAAAVMLASVGFLYRWLGDDL